LGNAGKSNSALLKKESLMPQDNFFSVRDFGAVGDGAALDTRAIQAAIDACALQSGGTVYFPPGTYRTGTLTLQSHVTLHVGPNAKLLGSTSLADYPPLGRGGIYEFIDNYCLLNASDAHHIALVGEGIVDGQGAAFPCGTEGFNFEDESVAPAPQAFIRPMLIHFTNCQDVTIRQLALQHAASWCCNLETCKEVRIQGVHLFNRANQNNDGFDITDCEDVMISDSHIDCGDDAIALKEGGRRIVVTNCIISTRWSAIRIGPEARGVFRDIAVSNCVIYDTYGCAIKLQEVEGGVMENISFDNLVMTHVTGPISLRLGGYRGYKMERAESLPIGVLRNIRFSNIQATVADNAYPLPHEVPAFPGEKKSCVNITGVPGFWVENITLSGIHFTFPGGGDQEDACGPVPELRDHYPEYHMFGALPAYGMYVRHAKGISLENVVFDLENPDLRPAFVCDDVEDLELGNVRASVNSEREVLQLRDTRCAFIHGCRVLTDARLFANVTGAASREILLMANDLRRVAQPYAVTDGANQQSVQIG
jgi:hypothetical protein